MTATALRSRWRTTWLPGACVLLLVGTLAAMVLLAVLNGDASVGDLAFSFSVATFTALGALIVAKRPDNAVGWIFTATGLLWVTGDFSAAYVQYGFVTAPGSVPLPGLAAWYGEWYWIVWLISTFAFVPLLFPTGRPLTDRWARALKVIVAWLAIMTLLAMLEDRLDVIGQGQTVRNPLGIRGLHDVEQGPVAPLLFSGIFASLITGLVAIVVRFRRSRGEERQQLKWFTFAIAALAVDFVAQAIVDDLTGNRLAIVDAIAFAGVPVAAAIAILKYRLYDIDVVINKTLVFGGLAAFITAVYVAIVVGIGTSIGQGEESNLGLSIAATAVVAVAFQPVRERVQRFTNRLVYGKRATPYEVLSEFSDRVAETYATEDVLPRMAKTVAEGTGAAHAEVWLRSGEDLRRAAAWPQDESVRDSLAMSNGSVPGVPNVDRVIEVRHQGELLGALTVTKPAGEPLTPAEDKLLSDLAGQAGLVLRNVGLTSELLARLEELKASRQRLVAAQDEERRRLERNLHDGAQQHLVALKMKLSLAERLAKDEDEKLRNAIAQLSADADETLDTLRDLARGIYPPLLADQGLKAALESQARKASVPVTVEADGLSRYPQEVEAAVYFCVLEALQNVAKYANPSRAWVTVSERDGELVFEVRDDGAGFDPSTTPKGAGTANMSDRLESLGGSLELRSRPGEGTIVRGRLPAQIVESAA